MSGAVRYDRILAHPAQAVLLCVDRPESEAEWAERHFYQRQQSFVGQLLRCHLAPEKNTFKIEQARELLAMCATQSPEGQGLWVWLSAVDCFTPEAANAILKLLEEPWARQWFVLTTARPDAVLPTIRSRCMLVRTPHRVQAPGPEALVENLDSLTKHEKLALAESLADDESEGQRFLQAWLGQLRWKLSQQWADRSALNLILSNIDAILRVLSHWSRPIQKRLALESLFFRESVGVMLE